MRVVTARLVRRGCADGLFEINADVTLGKTYQVDADSIRSARFFNKPTGIFFDAEIITTIDHEWLPLGILELDAAPESRPALDGPRPSGR
jgi:hypothetical protein